MMTNELKDRVRDFWNKGSCGEVYAQGEGLRERLEAQAAERYRLEPYIETFSQFEQGAGLDVLEIGVGMGADHLRWAESKPRSLSGVDLTPRAVDFTSQRLALYGYISDLRVADAENLPFADNSFDLVYSWGVLHHSPDTPQAFREAYRVLRPGGKLKAMIYHRHSLVGYMLWARYGLLRGQPGRDLTEIYAHHLESPGTKAYTLDEARQMLPPFSQVTVSSQLGFGDLLEGAVGQRHRGPILATAKRLYPRWLIRRTLAGHGLNLLIAASK